MEILYSKKQNKTNMNIHIHCFILICEILQLTLSKGIIRPVHHLPPKGVLHGGAENLRSEAVVRRPTHGTLQPNLDIPEIRLAVQSAEPTECKPDIYIAPVLNISTQSMDQKLAELTELVQHLSEQVRSLTDINVSTKPAGMMPRDCKEIIDMGLSHSGMYIIQPEAIGRPFRVYCDMETEGGGWIVFQRRFNGSENFRRSWPMYRRGFGDVGAEFWLGLDQLHRITVTDEFELRVEMQDFDDISMVVTYSWIRVDDITSNFLLHLGEYSGVGGDALSNHSGQQFSTFDRDHDIFTGGSCSKENGGGGWWFGNCLSANPNGLYLGGMNHQTSQGVVWNTWKGPHYSLKRFEMKIRPYQGN